MRVFEHLARGHFNDRKTDRSGLVIECVFYPCGSVHTRFRGASLELGGARSTKMPVMAAPKPSEDAPGVTQPRADGPAFRAIYEEHAAAVTRRLAHSSGDTELARDLAQETFVVAFVRLEHFRGESSLSTWLHAIAFNLLRDHRKRTRRRLSVWARLRGHPPPNPVEPDRALQSQEDFDRLRAILAELDDAQRDAFVLRVVEGVSLAEAATILGVRVATVSYRARRAEAIVRAAFEQGATK
jgi:RNA polymerase sigma-70 factor, ECF subfamily